MRQVKVFILEDDANRIKGFEQAGIGLELTIAMSMDEAKAKWNPPYDILLLDHDLGDRQMVDGSDVNTGSEFCRWVRVGDVPQHVIIHSYNRMGALNMHSMLTCKHDITPIILPYHPNLLTWMEALDREVHDGN